MHHPISPTFHRGMTIRDRTIRTTTIYTETFRRHPKIISLLSVTIQMNLDLLWVLRLHQNIGLSIDSQIQHATHHKIRRIADELVIGSRSVIANLHPSLFLFLTHLDHAVRTPANAEFLTMFTVMFRLQKHGINRTERSAEIDAREKAPAYHSQRLPLMGRFLLRTVVPVRTLKRLWIRMTQIHTWIMTTLMRPWTARVGYNNTYGMRHLRNP